MNRWISITLCLLLTATACGKDRANNKKNNGANNGSNNGANNGSNNGANNGSNNGANNGATNGANNGVNNGSNNGVNNGVADMGGMEDAGGTDDMGPPGPETVAIIGGTFSMGCDDCDPDEAPAHDVTLSPFAIDRTEVSQGVYELCVRASECTPPSDNYDPTATPDLPVVNVTWQQASDFCAWIGGGLPTEAQWERACAGPVNYKYPWGDDAASCLLAHTMGCGDGNVLPVDSLPEGASIEGALQMAGNVWEYTADWYAEDAYASHGGPDPRGPATGTIRVYRGGSAGNDASLARCANRASAYNPDIGGSGLGFRCAY